ncbi:hypothetical protein EYF80_025732 [Liparis tanakae]|uniref:Uncharacterized protein n=1 Tax=Liparis tanakae TaxID=230148 RepID=A0A4Z2HDT3_9TELE|nr:hypothetical protein EYF80_025732 [Liparis tanakae]
MVIGCHKGWCCSFSHTQHGFSAFRTITLMRWAGVWYCSRMNSWPKARGADTELFLPPNASWELTL